MRRSRTSSNTLTQPGISSAAFTSTWPRTARTRKHRSRFWPPTPAACRATARHSTCPSAKRYANTRVRPTSSDCCRCCFRYSGRPRPARGCARWSTRARSFILCAGRPTRRFDYWATPLLWKARAWCCACRRGGKRTARPGPRSQPSSVASRRSAWARMPCSTLGCRLRSTARP